MYVHLTQEFSPNFGFHFKFLLSIIIKCIYSGTFSQRYMYGQKLVRVIEVKGDVDMGPEY